MKINILKNHLKKGFLIVKLRFVFLPTAFIVYPALVHCRVGSLEREKFKSITYNRVHCRVGSIEIYKWRYNQEIHCLLNRLKIVIFKEGE